ISTFSHPVRSRSEVSACGMTPMFSRTWRGCLATSKPATNAWPPLGTSRVVSIRTTVVLPAPLGPSSPNTSPRRTSKLTWSTAVKVPKRLVRSLVCIASESSSIGPRESDFRGHPGFEFAFSLQHLDLDIKSSNVLAAASHVALGSELAFLPNRHDAPGEDLRRVRRQFDLRRLADVERAEVGLLDVDPRPNRREIVDRENRHARRHPFADFERLADDDAVDRRLYFSVGDLIGVELGVGLRAEHVGLVLIDGGQRVIERLGRKHVRRGQCFVAREIAPRLCQVGLRMSEVGLRLGELISEIDILDPRDHLALGNVVAFDQIELLDPAADAAGDIYFGRFDHADDLDRRTILGRPQMGAAEIIKSRNDTGKDCEPNDPANQGSDHCGCTGREGCAGSAPSDRSIMLPSSRLSSATGRLSP